MREALQNRCPYRPSNEEEDQALKLYRLLHDYLNEVAKGYFDVLLDASKSHQESAKQLGLHNKQTIPDYIKMKQQKFEKKQKIEEAEYALEDKKRRRDILQKNYETLTGKKEGISSLKDYAKQQATDFGQRAKYGVGAFFGISPDE